MWLCSLEGVEASHSTSHPTCYWIRDDDRSREEYGNLSSAMSPLCLSICGGYLSPDSSGDTEMEKGDFNEQPVRSRSFSSHKQSACWPPSVTFSMDFVFFFMWSVCACVIISDPLITRLLCGGLLLQPPGAGHWLIPRHWQCSAMGEITHKHAHTDHEIITR